MVPKQGDAMAEMPASLIASTWSLMILRNADALQFHVLFSSFEFTAANKKIIKVFPKPVGRTAIMLLLH